MNANVLAAQRWVNATYTGVAGYNRITEDGSAGWQTMYALTRGLQHELGLSALSDSFGPATLAALSTHGPIGPGETNQNLVKIVQCAAYCKDYDPGGITGTFGTATAAAVAALMTDAGLAARIDGTVPPKVVKAMLTMDSYRLATDALPSLRAAQQWLNNRYLARSAFFVQPCDGRRTRAFLKALTFGVQYESGQTDSQADGVLGPGSQAALRAKGLIRPGSTGAWVQLFSAALTLYPAAQRFTATFGDALAAEVRAFQAFCLLTTNGEGDLPTWASLLISTGDQSRPAAAADTIVQVTTARAQTLRAAGHLTVGRYLTNVEGTSLDKKIKPGELATLAANGLRLFPIYQTFSDSASYFSWAQGYADALTAHDAAVGHGIDAGAVIYFAVDYDATDTDVDQRITPHFLGVEAGLRARGRRYAHGVYGARNICSRLAREAFPRWSFVSGITWGWTGNMAFPLPENWAFDQIATVDRGLGHGRPRDRQVRAPPRHRPRRGGLRRRGHPTGRLPGVDRPAAAARRRVRPGPAGRARPGIPARRPLRQLADPQALRRHGRRLPGVCGNRRSAAPAHLPRPGRGGGRGREPVRRGGPRGAARPAAGDAGPGRLRRLGR